MPARKKPCTHEGYETSIAEVRIPGVGWTVTVWCALCGAIGFRDYRPPAPLVEVWRKPGEYLEVQLPAVSSARAGRSARSRRRPSKGT